MAFLSPKEFGDKHGISAEVIRRYCKRKDVKWAKRDGRLWMVDEEKALAWLNDPKNTSKIAARAPVEIPVQTAPVAAPTSADPITQTIATLQLLVSAMAATMGQGKISPHITQMFKQVSSELRDLITLQREERQANDQLMEKEEHRIVVNTLARLVEQEGSALKMTVPESMITELSRVEVEFEEPKKAMTIMAQVMRDEWEKCLGRMSDFIRDAVESRTRSRHAK